jgi:hypothetical protein
MPTTPLFCQGRELLFHIGKIIFKVKQIVAGIKEVWCGSTP